MTSPGGPQPAILTEPLVIYQGATWSLPMRLLAGGALIDTTSYDVQFTVRSDPDGGQAFFASVGNGLITVGFDPPKWQASHAYGLGEQIVPTTLNGYVYEVTTAGTSAGSEPGSWSTTIGGTTTSGTATFTVVSTDALVTNLRINLVPTDTDNVAEWGYGYFSLEITDTFSREYPILEGYAVLRRAITRPAA
jgi:hypothetical protein